MFTVRRCWMLGLIVGLSVAMVSHGASLYRDGTGARAMSMGGADVAWAPDALGAMAANPAALTQLTSPTLDLGAFGSYAAGGFFNRANNNGQLDVAGGLPEAAFGIPLKSLPITIGISVAPEMAANSDWFYNDTPGGLGGTTTYGPQQHRSQIVVLRSAIGLGWKLSDKWSVGASFGAIYNDNTLHAPYIFQSQPTLAGAKTLLDLRTDGFGFNGQIGVMFRPRENLQFGLTYKSETVVRTEGTATGDAGAQFAVPSVPFRYNAFVKNRFPHVVTGGASWQVDDKWRLAFQMDWIGWKDAFKTLPVRLQNGSSAAVNAIVGSTSLNDNVPLNWRDQVIVRAGVEYALTESFKLRGGYAYGNSPVPDATLTPLTAVINEHTFTAGLGYTWRKCQFDFAYQLELPASRNVGASGLLSGEYSNSRTDVTIHTLAFTTSIRF